MMSIQVLAQSDDWAVIAKPARLACHRSHMVRDRTTLIDLLWAQFDRDVHLVHRLDRPVSGCLVVAFDTPTTQMLQAAMSDAAAEKVYLAQVRGFFRWDDPVDVDTSMRDSRGHEREAHSVVEVLGRAHEPRSSLVRVRPTTGRTHQVRRHVRDLDHPILLDSTHGDGKANAPWRDQHGMARLALHCLRMHLPLPDGGVLDVTCPPPEDLVAIWRAQPWWAEAVAREPRLALDPLALLAPEQQTADDPDEGC